MINIKEKINNEELLNIFLVMSICGTILMWMFYLSFTADVGSLTYLILAIIFTIATPAFFALLWLQRKKG
jgi:hypothetical protein